MGRGAGAHPDPLPVRIQREAELVGIGDRGVRRLRQELAVVADGGEPIAGEHRLQIEQRRGQPSAHLRRAGTRDPDLVEREVEVRIPVHDGDDEPHLALIVAVGPSRG